MKSSFSKLFKNSYSCFSTKSFFSNNKINNYGLRSTNYIKNFGLSTNISNIYNIYFSGFSSLVRKDNSKCFYQILNIAPDSSQEEIKKTYYTLAKKYHPDNVPNSALNQTVYN